MSLIYRMEKRWLSDPALQALSNDQTRAIIDALALAVYADHVREHDEEDTFDSLLLTLPCGWSEIQELDEHAMTACKEAALLGSAEALEARVREVANAIDASVRPQVFSMLVAVTVADKEINPGEVAVLNSFVTAFGLSDEDAQRVYADTLDTLGLVEEDEQG